MKSMMRALAVVFVLGTTTAVFAADPAAPAPKAEEKKCTPDGKECKTGADCKAENCKK